MPPWEVMRALFDAGRRDVTWLEPALAPAPANAAVGGGLALVDRRVDVVRGFFNTSDAEVVVRAVVGGHACVAVAVGARSYVRYRIPVAASQFHTIRVERVAGGDLGSLRPVGSTWDDPGRVALCQPAPTWTPDLRATGALVGGLFNPHAVDPNEVHDRLGQLLAAVGAPSDAEVAAACAVAAAAAAAEEA